MTMIKENKFKISDGFKIETNAEIHIAQMAIVSLIRHSKGKCSAEPGNRIIFQAGFFRLVSNWNLLGIVDSGEIFIYKEKDYISIRYNASVFILFFLSILSVLFFLIPVSSDHTIILSNKILILFIVFFVFFFGNIFIFKIRFRGALKKIIKQIT